MSNFNLSGCTHGGRRKRLPLLPDEERSPPYVGFYLQVCPRLAKFRRENTLMGTHGSSTSARRLQAQALVADGFVQIPVEGDECPGDPIPEK